MTSDPSGEARRELESPLGDSSTDQRRDHSEDVSHLLSVVLEARFSGPLPPPSMLAGYEAALPGAAERVIKLAEDEAVHRRCLEMEQAKVAQSEVSKGQNYAFVLVLAAIAGGTLIGVLNPSWAGSIGGAALGVGGMSAVAAIFITRRRARKDEAADDTTKEPG